MIGMVKSEMKMIPLVRLFDNKYLTKINHREWGEMTVVAPATRYSQTSVNLPDESESWHEPLLGENSMKCSQW